MTKYGVSNEGVESLDQLAGDLDSLNEEIHEAGRKLSSRVSAVEEGLGIFDRQIINIVSKVNATQEAGNETVDQLSASVKKLASEVEALVSAGF